MRLSHDILTQAHYQVHPLVLTRSGSCYLYYGGAYQSWESYSLHLIISSYIGIWGVNVISMIYSRRSRNEPFSGPWTKKEKRCSCDPKSLSGREVYLVKKDHGYKEDIYPSLCFFFPFLVFDYMLLSRRMTWLCNPVFTETLLIWNLLLCITLYSPYATLSKYACGHS